MEREVYFDGGRFLVKRVSPAGDSGAAQHRRAADPVFLLVRSLLPLSLPGLPVVWLLLRMLAQGRGAETAKPGDGRYCCPV